MIEKILRSRQMVDAILILGGFAFFTNLLEGRWGNVAISGLILAYWLWVSAASGKETVVDTKTTVS